MEVMLFILLIIEGCMSCKYTPAAPKKELSKQLFSSDYEDFSRNRNITHRINPTTQPYP